MQLEGRNVTDSRAKEAAGFNIYNMYKSPNTEDKLGNSM